MINLQIDPKQKKIPLNVPLRGAEGRGRNGKESTQWKYITCFSMNKRIMNDFKRVFLYILISKKLDLQVYSQNNGLNH